MNTKTVLLKGIVLTLGVVGLACCHTSPEAERKATDGLTADSLKVIVYEWRKQSDVPDSAITMIDDFYRLAAERKNFQDMTTALTVQFIYYRGRDNVPATYRSVLDRIKVSKLSGDSLLIYDAFMQAGVYHFTQGGYWDALDYFLQMTDMPHSTDQQAWVYYALGQTYSQVYEDDSLISYYYNLAEEEMKKPDFTKTELKGSTLFGKAVLYMVLNPHYLYEFDPHTPAHVDSLKTAVSLLEESDICDPDSPNTLGSIAFGYALLGDFDAAHRYEDKAMNAAQKIPDMFSMIHHIRALIRYREKRFSEAIEIAKLGLEVSLANGKQDNAIDNADVLFHACTVLGDYQNACTYSQLCQTVKDSILHSEKQAQIIANQVKYDTRIKEQLLLTEKARSKSYLKTLLFIAGGFAVSTAILALFVVLYRQKRAAYRGLYRQIKEQDYLKEELEQLTNQYDKLLQSVPPSVEAEVETVKERHGDKQQNELVRRLNEYLFRDKNFSNSDIDLDGLAPQIATNRRYLFESVKAVTGKTLMEYIQTLRLNESRQLLDNDPDLTIEAIAADSGFNNRQTFYRLFKEQYNISPAEYRKMVKNR